MQSDYSLLPVIWGGISQVGKRQVQKKQSKWFFMHSRLLLKLGINERLDKLVGKSTLVLMHIGKENFFLTQKIWGENLLMARGIFCWSINIPMLRWLLLLVISWFLCPVKNRRIKPSWHCSWVLGLSHCDCYFMRQFWYHLLKCWMLWQQEW